MINLLHEQGKHGWQVVEATSLREWLTCIAQAQLLVSGRFHHTIAAAFLGVPCVLLESNTLKNLALAESLKIEPPIQYQVLDEEILLERTEHALGKGPIDSKILSTLRERIACNFDKLS